MPIRILNCASMYPWWPRWNVAGVTLLVDTLEGPVLVDTGLGLHDHTDPSQLVKFFRLDFGIPYAPEETAIRRVEKLGIDPQSIHHIILTHAHFDHAGGIPDFPWAKIHLHRQEYEAVQHPHTWIERFAYDWKDFSIPVDWILYDTERENWYEFEAIRMPFEPEMYLIPLFGHTSGHCGVAIRDGEGWHFHCADALPVNAEFGITPGWINRMVIGPHVDRLKRFSNLHPEIQMTAGHAWMNQERRR